MPQGSSVRDHVWELGMPLQLFNDLFERSFQRIRSWLGEPHPHIDIVDFEARHSPNAEQPAEFNKAVRSFLQAPI